MTHFTKFSDIKRDDLISGAFLFSVAFIVLFLGTLTVTELQERSFERSSELHRAAAMLRQIRRDALAVSAERKLPKSAV